MSLISKLYGWQYILRQQYANRKYKSQTEYNNSSREAVVNPEKVLIICAGLIGDSVMSSPVFIRARQIWQSAEITILGQKHNLDLFAGCPEINKFYETPVIPFSLRERKKEKYLLDWLKSQKFDVAISLLGGQFGEILAEAKIPIRACGNLHTHLPNCFTHLYNLATPRTWGANEQLNSLRCLGFEVDYISPKLWLVESARQLAEDKLKILGLGKNEKYVVIHPFGSTKRQWWGIEKVEKLAKHLLDKYDLQTILIGGKETAQYVPITTSQKMINSVGQLTLPELLSVIDESVLVISTDSGPFHIAGALEKPLIGLFRSSRPEHANSYSTAKVVFGENKTCQKLCSWNYCRSNPCEQLLSLEGTSVIEFIENKIDLNLSN